MKNAAPLKDASSDSYPSSQAPVEAGAGSWLARIRRWLKPNTSLKEVLEEAIEEHQEQAEVPMAQAEKVILHNVLSFRDIKVGDIKVPRADITSVPDDISREGLKAHIHEKPHTRIPVYQGTLDRVVGFLHVKDLLPLLSGQGPFDIAPLLHPILFVPPSMRIIDLLLKMRRDSTHMAIIVDEYGGTDGLVTMEDVLEEIVGDIQDEHDIEDEHSDRIQRVGPQAFEVSARISIATLEEGLGRKLTEADKPDFDTLGGLIFSQLGRVPTKGEIVMHPSGTKLEIIEADPRRIRRVRIVTA